MQGKYKNALAEVDKILDVYYDESVELIPISFRKFIKENKTYHYKFELDGSLALKEQNLLPETKAILAVIYRDFLATKEERQEFINKQREKEISLEKEKMQKYNPNDLFKSTSNSDNISIEDTNKNDIQLPATNEKISFFKKIIFKIKSFFGGK